MYRKLLSYVGKFVFVRQGSFNRYYEGKLLSLDTDILEIQSYKKDGTEEEIWTITLDSISEFSVGGRHLSELELKVSYALSDSHDDEESEDGDGKLLLLQTAPQSETVKSDAEETLEPSGETTRLDEIEN